MKRQVYCFIPNPKLGEPHLGAGCRKPHTRGFGGCSEDIGYIWIDETPPIYLRGKDKEHKNKRYD